MAETVVLKTLADSDELTRALDAVNDIADRTLEGDAGRALTEVGIVGPGESESLSGMLGPAGPSDAV